MRSNLVPTTEPQLIDYNELVVQLINGAPFGKDGIERDTLAIALLASMGYNHLFNILSSESLAILKHTAQNIKCTDERFVEMLRYLENRDKAFSDHKSRIEGAEEEGRRLIVKNLFRKNPSVDDISKNTGLTFGEIKKLIEEN